MIPLLLRPEWKAMQKRWTVRLDLRGQAGRDMILSVFGIFVAFVLYRGTLWTLEKVNANPAFSYLPAGDLLGMVFMVLFIMLVISSLLLAIGTLFLSEDLELVLASPLRPWSFYIGKFWYVYLASAWMPLLFIAPVLLAFGQAYHANLRYYAGAALLMTAYFAIPAAIGLVFATVLVLLIPAYRVREMLILLFVVFVAGIYMVVETIGLRWSTLRSAEEMLRILSILSMPSLYWLPSNWFARGVQELLEPPTVGWELYALLLWLTTVACGALGYLCVCLFQDQAFSLARNKKRSQGSDSRTWQKVLRRLGAKMSPPLRGLLGKELRVLSRDMAQAVQLLLVMGLALIYLYHMRVFSAVESFPDQARMWWRAFMFMGNVCMGAFITTAVCTRFVYPSVSYEGRSFWVLQASPLSAADILQLKFRCWLLPITVLSTIFFVSGAIVIGGALWVVLINAFTSVVMCYGITGLALGLGAAFAYFEWEHPSQLVAGFGSFVFMLCSIGLIFVSMIPAGFVLFRHTHEDPAPLGFLTIVLASLAALVIFNVFVAKFSLRKGAESLERFMR